MRPLTQWEPICREWKDVNTLKMADAVLKDCMKVEGENNIGNQWVKLNVGGTCFLTTKTTLSRDPNSFLYRLCQEDTSLISDRVSIGQIDRTVIYSTVF